MGTDREETLLAHAERVSSAPSSTRGLYWWTSNTEVVTLRPCSDPRFFQLGSIDTRTGQETPLDAFNNAFSRKVVGQKMYVITEGEPGSETVYNPPPCDLSPDGKWFLWLSKNRTWLAVSRDASRRFKWRKQSGHAGNEGVWLTDARWVELVSRYRDHRYTLTRAIIHSFDDDSERNLEELDVEDGLILGVTRSGHVFFRHPDEDNNVAEERVTFLNVVAEPPSARKTLIQLPPNWRVNDAHVSPVTDRVAWMLEAGDYFPREYSLCVSDLDGKDMRELGYMRGRSESSATNGSSSRRKYYRPESIRWLPDGQRLSFVFENELYVLDTS